METFFLLIILLITFYLLMVICDKYFVPALELIAEKLNMSSEMAGATLMAIGSSAPEFFTSVFALFSGGLELGAGTIVGSALFNVLVIIGASALYMTSTQKLSWQPIVRDMSFYVVAILLLLAFLYDGEVNKIESLILVIFYSIYLFAVKKWSTWLDYTVANEDAELEVENIIQEKRNLLLKFLDIIFPSSEKYIRIFFLSISIIAIVSYAMVETAVLIAKNIGVSPAIIGLTIVAMGTSVPDLFSSLIVAKKGKSDMAISNALGSNVFDIFIGLGLVYLLAIVFSEENRLVVNTEGLTSSIFLLLAGVILVLTTLILNKWRLGKLSGAFLITLYLGYLSYNIFKII